MIGIGEIRRVMPHIGGAPATELMLGSDKKEPSVAGLYPKELISIQAM